MTDDVGAGSLLVLIASAVVGLAAALAGVLGQAATARHRAAAAADLAAWAATVEAVSGPSSACSLARVVATRSGASVTSCRVTPTRVVVVAEVRTAWAAARAEGSWPRPAG